LENSGTSEPANFDWSPLDLLDHPVPFSKFKGKMLFLNIWATWCPPCVAEMPSIARLANDPRLRGKNIEFVCISTDESAAVVRSYLEGKNWPMTFLRTDKLPSAYYAEGIPATFLITADGRIAASQVGAMDWSQSAVAAFIAKLAESPPGAH
jgi:thiol-disulfide isomerase/thioredoxin